MIDKELQKKSRKEAIKVVAKRNKTTQKYVKSVLENKAKDHEESAIKTAVQNWTVELYHRGLQHRSK